MSDWVLSRGLDDPAIISKEGDVAEERGLTVLPEDGPEDGEEPGEPEAAGRKAALGEALVHLGAKLIAHSVAVGTTGNLNYKLNFEIDSAAAQQLIELMGEQAYGLSFADCYAGEGITLKTVPTTTDADNVPRSKLGVVVPQWAGGVNQITKYGPGLIALVGKTGYLELYETQLKFDLTKRAEDNPEGLFSDLPDGEAEDEEDEPEALPNA